MQRKHWMISIGVCVGFVVGVLGYYALQPSVRPVISTDVSEGVPTPTKQSDTSQEVVRDAHKQTAAAASTSSDRRQFATADVIVSKGKQYPLRTYVPLGLPNDPLVSSQWWVNSTKMAEAWDAQLPTGSATLAIIDTGFALAHEEFTNRWEVNAAETGAASEEASSLRNCTDRGLVVDMSCNLVDDDRDGIIDNESGVTTYENVSQLNCFDRGKPLDKSCNRIDDDANGHIDDHLGWDFINHDNSPQAGENNPDGDGTTHGTMVAGVAAATGNNAKGVAGVDWVTKILPLQALDDDSYGDTLSVGDAIYYAIKRKVDVISISLGSALPDDYVREAVQEARRQGIVVVAASGNDGCDCIVYPAMYPEVLAVGAHDSSGAPATFSSWGGALDILAPGTDMITTTWRKANAQSAYASGVNGTSFATPMVGGMLTRLARQQPTATPQQLIAALTENTNRTKLSSTTARDNRVGYGGLDAAKSTSRMATPYAPAILYAFSPVARGAYFDVARPLEMTGVGAVYACANNLPGGTPVYELKNAADHFFSSSDIEQHQATLRGYQSTLFTYGCLRQPHDAPQTVRQLNIFREFKNTTAKQ